jgi:SIR2-like domain
MSMIASDPLTQLAFALYENKGVFAVLLGSGLSRAAEIPTGWEITLDLIRRVALAQGIEEQPDWAAWYRERTGQEPDYSALLEELASSPEERRSILHNYIEPTEEDQEEGRKIPTAAHHAIADLVRGGYIRVIITTNFDRLMENALREHSVEPTIVASVDALAGAEPMTHSACYLLKLHGDYKDARILNTEAELGGYPAQYDSLLDRILYEHGLIVCGWSGEWDHALRAAFLRAPNRRYSVYWAARGKLGDGAEELVRHRRARVIPIADADGFFSTLRQRVETLEQSQRQAPGRQREALLAKPEYRIQLDELLTQETDRVLAQLDSADFALPAQWDQAVFRARVRKYESVTEALASITGVLGRWGDGSELPLVLEVIRSLYAQAEKVGGGLTFFNIRSYPAVLVFTAYGFGLTRAGRWGALHRLFDAVIDRQYRERSARSKLCSCGPGRAQTTTPGSRLRGLSAAERRSAITSSACSRSGVSGSSGLRPTSS